MKKAEIFICKLKEVIEFVLQECNLINDGKMSKWNKNQLEGVVIPEMQELLTAALKGKILFKYGKKQRLLKSTYLMTDSPDNLNSTVLGNKIVELQKLYNSL